MHRCSTPRTPTAVRADGVGESSAHSRKNPILAVYNNRRNNNNKQRTTMSRRPPAYPSLIGPVAVLTEDLKASNSSGADCSICMDEIMMGEDVAYSEQCVMERDGQPTVRHIYHKRCMHGWVMSKLNLLRRGGKVGCPACRGTISGDDIRAFMGEDAVAAEEARAAEQPQGVWREAQDTADDWVNWWGEVIIVRPVLRRQYQGEEPR